MMIRNLFYMAMGLLPVAGQAAFDRAVIEITHSLPCNIIKEAIV